MSITIWSLFSWEFKMVHRRTDVNKKIPWKMKYKFYSLVRFELLFDCLIFTCSWWKFFFQLSQVYSCSYRRLELGSIDIHGDNRQPFNFYVHLLIPYKNVLSTDNMISNYLIFELFFWRTYILSYRIFFCVRGRLLTDNWQYRNDKLEIHFFYEI